MRNPTWFGAAVLLVCGVFQLCPAAVAPLPAPADLPAHAGLPDPLVNLDGSRVTTRADWVAQRRPELKRLFEHYMYGVLPPAPIDLKFAVEHTDPQCFEGRATRKDIAIQYSTTRPPIHLLLVVPNGRSRPAPVVLGLNFCGNHTVLNDPTIALPTRWMPEFCAGCTNHQATDAGRGTAVDGWSIRASIDRGYAIATFYTGDLEPDGNGAPDGVRANYPTPETAARGPQAWGTIAAWAWGVHRAVDYLVSDPAIDTNRIAVFGHSRNGKTALLAGAFDERIRLVLCHQAGCGGSAPSRGRVGESVKQINDRFPHWFNGAFKAFNQATDRLPFDQHALVALCAPRPVLLSNATEDSWANPDGQFEMLRAADPVYRLLGVEGLTANERPAVGRLLDTRLGYFIRAGKHSTTPEDWRAFLDFADRHFGRP